MKCFSRNYIFNVSPNTKPKIFTSIYYICKNENGLGILTIYDLTYRICKYYKN
jgi:hypothetical protein